LKQPAYFVDRYCRIYDANVGDWVRFELWPAQQHAIDVISAERLVIALKARQVGLTWLALGFALHQMIFQPAATVLLFSRRDEEAIHLLDDRLKGMYERLPAWLHNGLTVVESNAHEFQLSNGSVARAFPTTAGDSYTASLAIVDEADLVPDLNSLMRAVKPTVDAGGRMILLSRADKSQPQSEFKATYRAAKLGSNDWSALFLPWSARPDRDEAWYEAQRRDVVARTGSLDDLHEQYPATDAEALAPRTLDKRVAPLWLEQCYFEQSPIVVEDAPAIPGLQVYAEPRVGKRYIIGVDPAEGNPTSDDSALTVLEADMGEEVAMLSGKLQPATIAAHADAIGTWYNRASVMVERNNHGHAVLLWLRDNSRLLRLVGHDGNEGWHSTTKGKALLYDVAADAFREGETILHSFETFVQLASIEGSTLRAPEGEMDDKADSYALALAGVKAAAGYRGKLPAQTRRPVLAGLRTRVF
jgi:hypothetical protein